MVKTTLIYLEKDNSYLFLCRNKKKNDMNSDKYIGIGGHFESGESPEECLNREVKEETGVALADYRFLGLIHFKNSAFIDEDIYLYTGHLVTNSIHECDEGTFYWINKEHILSLNLWEGDKLFLPLLSSTPNNSTFELTLFYNKYDLVSFEGPIFK